MNDISEQALAALPEQSWRNLDLAAWCLCASPRIFRYLGDLARPDSLHCRDDIIHTVIIAVLPKLQNTHRENIDIPPEQRAKLLNGTFAAAVKHAGADALRVLRDDFGVSASTIRRRRDADAGYYVPGERAELDEDVTAEHPQLATEGALLCFGVPEIAESLGDRDRDEQRTQTMLEAARPSLSQRQYSVLRLRLLHNLALHEIAEHLGCTEPAISYQLQQVRKKLAACSTPAASPLLEVEA